MQTSYNDVQPMSWKQLQNGSDIRGVALEGVADESVNLTPERVKILGQAFVTWLSQQDQPPSAPTEPLYFGGAR